MIPIVKLMQATLTDIYPYTRAAFDDSRWLGIGWMSAKNSD